MLFRSEGRAELVSFADAVFNPSTLPRTFHTLVASLISGAFFMGGISAWMVLNKRQTELAVRSLKVVVIAGAIGSVLALFPTGHSHAEQVARTQPEKFAAIEGLYERDDAPPMVIFALPSTEPPTLHARLEIPGMLGWLAFGDPDAEIKSLADFPPEDVPEGAELWLSFVSFHNMVLLGMFFIGMTFLGLLLLWRRRLTDTERFVPRWWLRLMVLSIPLPVIACELGWIVAEVGRQPWIVYHLLRTEDAASTAVDAGEVLFSIVLFGVVYLLLGALWLFVLVRKIRRGFPAPTGAAGGEKEAA